jgi:hypothetical protein
MIFAITSHYHYTPHGTPPSTVEQYNYDADGERLSRSHDGLTTFYLAGLLEDDVQSGVVVATRTLYTLQGQVVATRTPGGLFYLHADHLGSVALSVNAATTRAPRKCASSSSPVTARATSARQVGAPRRANRRRKSACCTAR